MADGDVQGDFDDILAMAGPALGPLCTALRAHVAAADPGFVEVVWPKLRIASYGVGPKKKTQHYAYVAVQGAHVNLGFYHGTTLPDPEGRLEGTGKTLRHVKIRDAAAIADPAIAALLEAAIEERRSHA